eukprot:jgi/Undpi1/7297/HiC_scaffold_22.g09770.m1
MMVGRASAAIFFASVSGTQGFVQIAPVSSCCGSRVAPHVTSMKAEGGLTRGEAVQRAAAGSGVLAAGVLLAPLQQSVAWAAEGKDGTEQFGELRGELERKEKEEEASVSKENLEKLTEAAAGLKTLDFYIGEKDYQALRLAMRRPPIVYLRASARKVIVSMDNEVEAKKAQSAYTALITSVDKLDGLANRGMKEKEGLKDNKEIMEVFDNCVERGSALLALVPSSS